jgi:hypothetical protein
LPGWVIQAQVGHLAPEMMKTYSHIRRPALNQAAPRWSLPRREHQSSKKNRLQRLHRGIKKNELRHSPHTIHEPWRTRIEIFKVSFLSDR